MPGKAVPGREVLLKAGGPAVPRGEAGEDGNTGARMEEGKGGPVRVPRMETRVLGPSDLAAPVSGDSL